MDDNFKEVYYWKWCPKCKHKDTAEELEPCFECLANPSNVDSHKPLKWEEK